jgi:dihydroflavonol-4-reductase
VAARFDRSLRSVIVSLGRRDRHTTDKTERLLGRQPRPAAETVVACAESLLARRVV